MIRTMIAALKISVCAKPVLGTYGAGTGYTRFIDNGFPASLLWPRNTDTAPEKMESERPAGMRFKRFVDNGFPASWWRNADTAPERIKSERPVHRVQETISVQNTASQSPRCPLSLRPINVANSPSQDGNRSNVTKASWLTPHNEPDSLETVSSLFDSQEFSQAVVSKELDSQTPLSLRYCRREEKQREYKLVATVSAVMATGMFIAQHFVRDEFAAGILTLCGIAFTAVSIIYLTYYLNGQCCNKVS